MTPAFTVNFIFRRPAMRRNVCVLGGGIGGLSAAHFLKHRARKAMEPIGVRVIEASPRFGGNLRSVRCEGFLFEAGPRSLRVTENSVATLKLIQHLDLEKHMIVGAPAVGLTYTRGAVGPFESHPTFKEMLRITYNVLREPFIPRTKKEDESIYEFTMRRFGRYITEYGVDPLASGIFAGDIKKLSMRSCFAKYWNWEQKHGSVVRGHWNTLKEAKQMKKKAMVEGKDGPLNPLQAILAPFQGMPVEPGGVFSFSGGLSMLTDALAQELSSDEKIVGKAVTGLRFRKTGAAVELSDGSLLECDAVISALPNHVLAPLLKPHNERLAELLSQVTPTSIAVVNFGFNEQFALPKAFGYLVPSCEDLDVLGVVFDSVVFPAQNPGKTSITVMLGGEHHLKLMQLPEQELAARAMQQMSYHTGSTPALTHVAVWKQGIPQYLVGHHVRVAEIEELLRLNFPQLRLTGSGLYGVGVNDCTMRSQEVVRQLYAKGGFLASEGQVTQATLSAAPEGNAEVKS